MKTRILLLCAFLMTAVSFAGEWSETVKEMTGLRGGVCVIPATDNAAAVMELAKESGFVVLAQNGDGASVRQMREKALPENLLADKVYFVHSGPDSMNVMNDFADVVFLPEADKATLTAELAREIKRVLSPGRGFAVIGSKAEADSLKTFASQLPGA